MDIKKIIKINKKYVETRQCLVSTGLIFLFLLFAPLTAHAVTEFVSVVDPDSGAGYDYASLSAWEDAIESDLTAATTLVIAGSLTRGAIGDAVAITQTTTGATATCIHHTTTQMMVTGMSGAPNTTDTWYPAAEGDDTTSAWTPTDAGDSVIAVAKCRSTGGTADTTNVAINGWTTSSTNYIKVWADPSEAYRHSGKWNTSAYRIESDNPIAIYESFTVIDGLQVKITQNSQYDIGIAIETGPYTNIVISNNIVNYTNPTGSDHKAINASNNASITAEIRNNIVYNSGAAQGNGIFVENGTVDIFNNTVYGFTDGIELDAGTIVATNNVSFGNTDDFNDTATTTIDNNASDDGDGTNVVTPADWTAVFIDYENFDFHLLPTDTDLKDAGASDPGSGSFSDDIEGFTRGEWDIGADEASTEFVAVVDPDSGAGYDYASLSLWEDAIESDLTAADTKVIAGSLTRGSFSDNVAITQTTTGATATMLHDTSTQILLTSVSGTPNNSDTWYPTADGDDTTNAWTPADAGNPPIAVATCRTTSNSVDATSVTVAGWTTSTTNYIKIWTDPTEAYRHDGTWGNGYRITGYLIISEENVRVDGISIQQSGTNRIFFVNSSTGSGEIYISNCFGHLANATATTDTFDIYNVGSLTVWLWNNIGITDSTSTTSEAFYFNDANITVYAYNNTGIANAGTAFRRAVGTAYLKNCIGISTSGSSFLSAGAWSGSVNYSISDDATSDDWAGTGNKINQSVSFLDSENDDFHLSPTDTAARNAGTDLSADANLAFSTDIDGNTRPNQGAWDIGADEASKGLFYSVGQDTATDNKTGTPTFTIASGLATFDTAQTGNIGVGDKVTYDTTSVAYISRKVDTSNWYLVTATGEVPADEDPAVTVDSIKRTFGSLSSGLTGAVGASYLNDTDLTTTDTILNLPCYYDTGADTTAAVVNGYTTGPNNFIKIYTPNNTTTESNSSQRHQGKWNALAYNVDVALTPIRIVENYVRLDGLQLKHTNAGNSRGNIWVDCTANNMNGSQFYFSNNIIKGPGGAPTDNYGMSFSTLTATAVAKIWNNIIYDIGTGANSSGITVGDLDWDIYAYNNTVYNTNRGYSVTTTGTDKIFKNNIAQNCTDGFYNSDSWASGTNYNLSDIAADAPGANSKNGVKVAFLNVSDEDFHLAAMDIAARDAGTDLSADSNISFSTDIDGQTRPYFGFWDIGADETNLHKANAMFFSAGF